MKRKSLSQTLVDSARALRLEKVTVDKLDSLNIPEVKRLGAREIRQIRRRLNASQGVFARYLNVSPFTVQKWERGAVAPQNAALKLLNLVDQLGVEILIGTPDARRQGGR